MATSDKLTERDLHPKTDLLSSIDNIIGCVPCASVAVKLGEEMDWTSDFLCTALAVFVPLGPTTPLFSEEYSRWPDNPPF